MQPYKSIVVPVQISKKSAETIRQAEQAKWWIGTNYGFITIILALMAGWMFINSYLMMSLETDEMPIPYMGYGLIVGTLAVIMIYKNIRRYRNFLHYLGQPDFDFESFFTKVFPPTPEE